MNINFSKYSTSFAVIIAGLLIAGAIFYRGRLPAIPAGGPPANWLTPELAELKPLAATDHVRGSRQATLQLIEYSDLECPFCKRFHGTMLEINKTYGQTGAVVWVYRHFPLDKPGPSGQILHSQAGVEARATECAAKLGGEEAFWRYTDKIFEVTPSNNGLDLKLLPEIAAQLKLEPKAFQACLTDPATAERVESDYQSGLAIGVQGTPHSVIVAGKPITADLAKYVTDRVIRFSPDKTKIAVSGSVPYSLLKEIIDKILKAV